MSWLLSIYKSTFDVVVSVFPFNYFISICGNVPKFIGISIFETSYRIILVVLFEIILS